jgi:hypothetical protein
MKALTLFAAALVLCAAPSFALAGHCPAAVQVQQVHAAPVVVAQPVVAAVAAPVFVVPATPTVAVVQQQVFAAPVVVAQPVVAQKVVQQRQAIVQQRAPVTRSTVIQRSVTR